MKIKHSKYKNTGLIFELLVKQIAADTLSKKDSPALSIIKKFYTKRSALLNEFKIYQFLLKNRAISQNKAESILSTIVEITKKIDKQSLRKQKYQLISEIKKHYDLDEFFKIQVRDYKPLAAMYCLLESYEYIDQVNPEVIVNNKVTILEHLTSSSQNLDTVKDIVMEEYAKLDKDVKLLTFRILLNKFNENYQDLLPAQKQLLGEFITSTNSAPRLRNIVNEEITKISKKITEHISKITDKVLVIKLQEVVKGMTPLSNKDRIEDKHLINLMQYYELIHELEAV